MDDVLDDALERLRGTWTEVAGGGDPNHGPMAAEALVAMGVGDVAPGWASRYRARLTALPPTSTPVMRGSWREALGAEERLTDWIVFFHRELAEASWSDVLEAWLPRLVPAIVTAGRHALLRTAHATRALTQRTTALRVEELGVGLAYWASHYRALGPQPSLTGTSSVSDAVRDVPRLLRGKERPDVPRKFIYAVRERPELLSAVDALAAPASVDEALSDLSEAGARVYLANRSSFPLIFIHSVTPPAALRTLLPYMSRDVQRAAFAFFWHAEAATLAAYGEDTDVVSESANENLDWAEVIERCVADGDPHSIKLVEACWREDNVRPSPVYRAMAIDWLNRVRLSSSWTSEQRRAAGIIMG